jgi:predicted GNAT family N-acyltransferase
MISVERAASDEEFEEVFAIRKEVFVEEQGVPEIEEYDGYEPISIHYLACVDGVPAGCARWRVTPYHQVKLERFAVRKPWRDKGIGKAVLFKMLEEIPSNMPVILHAQEAAMGFYQKAGFVAEGERFFECDIPHFRMVYKPN